MTRATPALKAARRCYGHLAGELGVLLREKTELAGLLRRVGDTYRLTEAGHIWARSLDLDVNDRDATKHARCCVDWTEKLPHVGGKLGRSMLARLIQCGVVVAGDGRELRVVDVSEVWRVLAV